MERTRAPTPATGVPAIDSQVAELFGRAAALLQALAAGEKDEAVLRLITSLEQQAIVHFAAEEQLMLSRGYPAAVAHLREHDAFRGELKEAKDVFFRRGPCPELSQRLERLLSGWLEGHVRGSDAPLADFLTSPRPPAA
jgi:hemerythrin